MRLYDNKFAKFPSKFCMHWLGPYQVKHVTSGGVVQLVKLDGEVFPTLVNGSIPSYSHGLISVEEGVQMSNVVERDITHIDYLHLLE